MKEVFSHPLGPIPWSISTANGCLRKTYETSLSKYLEQLSFPTEKSLTYNLTTIINAVSIVHRCIESKVFRKHLAILLS